MTENTPYPSLLICALYVFWCDETVYVKIPGISKFCFNYFAGNELSNLQNIEDIVLNLIL